MGCTTSDLHSNELMDRNDELMLANSRVLQGITYSAVANQQFGLVIKLLNVQKLLNARYDELKHQRREVAQQLPFLTTSECQYVEATARKEHKELQDTYRALIKEYKHFRSLGLFASPTADLEDHCRAFEENRSSSSQLASLRKLYKSALLTKQELDSLVLQVNSQQPLNSTEHELVIRVACATTYKFTRKNSALSYETSSAVFTRARTRSSLLSSDSIRKVRRAIRRANRTSIDDM